MTAINPDIRIPRGYRPLETARMLPRISPMQAWMLAHAAHGRQDATCRAVRTLRARYRGDDGAIAAAYDLVGVMTELHRIMEEQGA